MIFYRLRRLPRYVSPCCIALGLILMLISVPTWLLFALLGLALACIGVIGCVIR